MSATNKIETTHPFLNSKVLLSLSNGISETLKMMTGLKCTFDKPFANVNWKTTFEVSVMLQLKSPPFTGQIRLHFDRKCIVLLYEKFSGQAVAESSDDLLDCVGELSNMCYGFAKTKLNEVGMKLNMSIPKAMNAADLPEAFSSHPNLILPYKIEDHACVIQLIMQNEVD